MGSCPAAEGMRGSCPVCCKDHPWTGSQALSGLQSCKVSTKMTQLPGGGCQDPTLSSPAEMLEVHVLHSKKGKLIPILPERRWKHRQPGQECWTCPCCSSARQPSGKDIFLISKQTPPLPSRHNFRPLHSDLFNAPMCHREAEELCRARR